MVRQKRLDGCEHIRGSSRTEEQIQMSVERQEHHGRSSNQLIRKVHHPTGRGVQVLTSIDNAHWYVGWYPGGLIRRRSHPATISLHISTSRPVVKLLEGVPHKSLHEVSEVLERRSSIPTIVHQNGCLVQAAISTCICSGQSA